jgi:hypothetical protein
MSKSGAGKAKTESPGLAMSPVAICRASGGRRTFSGVEAYAKAYSWIWGRGGDVDRGGRGVGGRHL